MVRGRYLATFSCNSFWNQRKIGSGVGSGTGFGSDLRQPERQNRAHFNRRLYSPSHAAEHTAGHTSPRTAVPSLRSGFRQKAPAALTPSERLKLSCQRTNYKPFTPGGSAIGLDG